MFVETVYIWLHMRLDGKRKGQGVADMQVSETRYLNTLQNSIKCAGADGVNLWKC